jgi:hypothetical protein
MRDDQRPGFGLSLEELLAAADSIADLAERQTNDQSPDATRRLAVILRLDAPPDAA